MSTDPSQDTVDLNSDRSIERWSKELKVTVEQLREAVAAVGNRPPDVEMHLKGSRSTTNADAMEASDQPAGAAAARSAAAPMSPGDEAPEGTPGTGENVCPDCGGSGQLDGHPCAKCSGTGKVIVGVGGA